VLVVSYACGLLFILSCVFLACAAGRISSGRPTFGLESGGKALLILIAQVVLLFSSSFAVYDQVYMQHGAQTTGMTILFVMLIYGLPITCATYYYVAVFGGWLGKSIYAPEVVLPGTEVPEIDKAMALSQRGDMEGAVELLETFLAEHPESIDALRFLAGLELRRERHGRAAELCERALTADTRIRLTKTGLAEEERVKILSLLADAMERGGRSGAAANVLEDNVEGLTTERFRALLGERARRLRGTV
jgi:hypothetical protein